MPEGMEGRAKTDVAGRVRFSKLTAHPVTLTIRPPKAMNSQLAALRKVDVLPGGAVLTLQLAAPLLLEGTVVDPAGVPVEGAGVTVNYVFAGGMPETKTEAGGRFTLALPPTLEDRIEVWAAFKDAKGVFLYADVSGVDPRAGPLRIELKLHRGW